MREGPGYVLTANPSPWLRPVMPEQMTRGIDRESLRTYLCLLVAAVWAGSAVASAVSPTYHPDPAINGIFGGMITLLLGPWNKDDDDADEDKGK